MKRALRKGDWVVCLTSLGAPSTWAKVTQVTAHSAWVQYYGPIWYSPAWDRAYLVRYPTLKAARAVVEEYEAGQRGRP